MTREEQIEKVINDDWNHLEGDCPDVAFRKGVNWADSHTNWHKYSEEKPQEAGNYLTAHFSGRIDIMMYSNLCGKFWCDEGVIAWMELPQPPKFD